MGNNLRHFLDFNAGGWSIAAFLGLLQPTVATIASCLSIVWLIIQIHEWYRKKKGAHEF